MAAEAAKTALHEPRRLAIEFYVGGGHRTHRLLIKKSLSIEYNLNKKTERTCISNLKKEECTRILTLSLYGR